MNTVCRSCLTANKTFIVQNADYQAFYQLITNVPFQDGSSKPTSLCYECLYLFRKCMQLRDKCLRADRVLNDFIENGEEISRESILKINRGELLLSSKCIITKVYCFEIGTGCKRDVKIENDKYELSENRDDEVKLEDSQSQYQDNNESNINIDHCSDDNDKVKIEDDHEDNDYMEIEEHFIRDTDGIILKFNEVCETLNCEAKTINIIENQPELNYMNKQYDHNDDEVIVDHLIGGLERTCTECNFKCLEQDVFEKHLKSHKHITEQFSDVHVRTHTGEKPFKCDVCNFKTARKTNLSSHMRTHTGDKTFMCDLCDYKSLYRTNLVVHIRTHTGEKPYKCNLCDFKCAQKGALVCHHRMHTGEKPFKCDFCNYKTRRNGHLNRHMQTHTGDKPHTCDFCDYKCSYKAQLDLHTRTHTGEKPYKCDFCNFKCSVKSNLNSHIKIHTGAKKPYKCDFCDYKCSYKAKLVLHTRKHTGEKPYECDLCGFSYKEKASLNRHKKKHIRK